jgi:hypothetical protein
LNTLVGILIGITPYCGSRLFTPEDEQLLAKTFGTTREANCKLRKIPWLQELIESDNSLDEATIASDLPGAEGVTTQMVEATHPALPGVQNASAFLVVPVLPPDASRVPLMC